MKTNNKNSAPPFEIIVNQEYGAWKNLPFDIEKETMTVIGKVLSKLYPGLQKGEVSVVLADDERLCYLNKTYRHQNKPTNILSFGYGKGIPEDGMLGDIFLSFEALSRESVDQKKSFHDHYIHLIIHGILHLLGYEHENEKDAKAMETQEIEFLKFFNISNPYKIL